MNRSDVQDGWRRSTGSRLPDSRGLSDGGHLLRLACLLAVLCGGLCALVAAPGNASAAMNEEEARDAVTQLNRKALEEFDNLSFEAARKILQEALDLCDRNGLENHPIKARTHIHMGVVLLAIGTGQRDEAIAEFRKGLAIQPAIKPSERLANPEVQSAFREAKAGDAGGTAGPEAPASPARSPQPAQAGAARPSPSPSPSPVAPPRSAVLPAPPTPGLSHDAVRSGAQGVAISIGVTTAHALAARKVALWFRPAGSTKFTSVDLREYSPGNWSGSIPETATAGDDVAYFISAENQDGDVVGTQGTAFAPLVVDLRSVPVAAAHQPGAEEAEGEGEGVAPDDGAPAPARERPTWLIGLAVGSGIGWTTGNGDVNDQDKVTSAFGWSQLGHVLPEVGHFVDPNVILSLQLRLQVVSGATAVRDPSGTMCGASHVCQPAAGAIAGLARVTWLLNDGTFVPYLSGVLGAGQIRHLATFPKAMNCGTDPAKPVQCVDTVAAGPILVGPGVGFMVHATSRYGLTLGVATILGFPQFTVHFDVNAGLVVEL